MSCPGSPEDMKLEPVDGRMRDQTPQRLCSGARLPKAAWVPAVILLTIVFPVQQGESGFHLQPQFEELGNN